MSMTGTLVNISKAARILGVSRQTVYNLIKRGKLIPVKIGDWPQLNTEQLDKLKREQAGGVKC